MSRFFVQPSDVEEKYIIIRDKNDIKHMIKVLRLLEGDKVDVSDSYQWEYSCTIDSIADDEITLEILDKQRFAREPKLEVTLFQGVPKSGKMDLIIQKCVELGVHNIVPVFMKRSVVVDNGKFDKKIQRWQKISDEAVKQCKRGIIPEIENQHSFKEMLQELSTFDLILFPYENEENYTLKDCLRSIVVEATEKEVDGLSVLPKSVAVIIGPEGGFSDEEAKQLDENHAVRVSLGKTILRTETAGMATLAMVMYELEL